MKVTEAVIEAVRVRVYESSYVRPLARTRHPVWIATVSRGDPETEDYVGHDGSGPTRAAAVQNAVAEWRKWKRIFRRRSA